MAISKGMYIINGVERALYYNYENDRLSDVLRRYGLTGLKIGCEKGQCGVCTVIVDGRPVRSCVKKMRTVKEYSRIETIEGIGIASNLHPVQRAWIKYGGVQCGFCTPGFIMSAKALLDQNPTPTREEVRDWFTKNANLCRCTGYKQLVDAVMAASKVISGEKPISWLDPEETPEDGTSIYHSHYPRPAALGKVMGVTDYGDDIGRKMPEDTLHLAVKLPDWAHANILSIDVSEAEKMPGVVKVITAKDVEGTNDMGSPTGMPRCNIQYNTVEALHDKKVRRSGDVIAIVAARTRKEARAAVEKIHVEYEKLPVYDNLLESCLPGAVRINEETDNMLLHQPVKKDGDPEEIFEQAKTDSQIHIVEGSFHSSRQPHLALEPDAAQAFYDEEGVLTVGYKYQHIEGPLKQIPKILGIDKCRVIETPTGASFGAAVPHDIAVYAAIAAHVLNKPVTLTLSWEEKQLITGKRGNHFTNYKAAVREDGKILALKHDSALEGGGIVRSITSNTIKGTRFSLGYYNVERMRALFRGGLANNAFICAYRGAGSPEIYTGAESIIDMMAAEIEMDPWEFRYRNIAREGDLTNNSGPYKLYPLQQMMDRFKPTYDEACRWRDEEEAPEGWKRGVGVSVGGYHVSFPNDNAEVAIELMPDGSITQYNCWEDQGQGGDIGSLVETVEALKPLGITADKVRLVMNDSRMCPITGVAGGSRSHFMAGKATIDAANKLMDAMRKIDGTYRTYDEMKEEGIPTWYKGVYNTTKEGWTDPDPDNGHCDPMPDQNFIINIVQVEVEEATGKTRIVKSRNLADVGVVGNFLALDGQAYGGIFQAMGYALSEHYSDFDKKCMTPLGCGFLRCNEVPDDFTIEYQETPRANGPFGSGGASECFQSVCHVCVLNAIYDATGVRPYDMPVTPKKLKAAMDAKAAGEDLKPEPFFFGRSFEEVMEDLENNPLGGEAENHIELV